MSDARNGSQGTRAAAQQNGQTIAIPDQRLKKCIQFDRRVKAIQAFERRAQKGITDTQVVGELAPSLRCRRSRRERVDWHHDGEGNDARKCPGRLLGVKRRQRYTSDEIGERNGWRERAELVVASPDSLPQASSDGGQPEAEKVVAQAAGDAMRVKIEANGRSRMQIESMATYQVITRLA